MKNANRNVIFGLVASLGVFSGCLQSTNQKRGDVNPASITSEALASDSIVPVVVLGGGVAGLTAAIYLAQANIPTLVIEGPKPGGALSQSHAVRNWPGAYNESGLDIVQKIKNHALVCGAKIIQGHVTAVNLRSIPLVFEVDSLVDGKPMSIKAVSCIVAMGAEPNFLNIPGERGADGYWGRGVSNCAVCDGFFFKGKRVIVVGGGDSAVEEAHYLADIAQSVTVVVRKGAFRAKDIRALDRLLARKNITVRYNAQLEEIKGDGSRVTEIRLQKQGAGRIEHETIKADGVFLAIGSHPNTDLFKGQIPLDERGFIILQDHQSTGVPGVFAAGDIADPFFVQAITAAGDGCRAALQVKRYLESTESVLTSSLPQKISERCVRAGVVEIEREEEFKELVQQSKKPVFLDLYANWCFPCKRMVKIVEKLANDFADQVSFVKLDVQKESLDTEKLLASIHGRAVYSVPTFILVKNGREVRRIDGSRDYEILKKIIETMLEDQKNLALVG